MDKELFKRIWLPLWEDFYRAAYYMLGNEADAKDAVQDLYIRLWNVRDRLDGITSPHGYGLRVLRNLCIDRLRADAAHREYRYPLDATAEAGCTSYEKDAEEQTAGRETVTAVMNAIEQLPDNQKAIVRMRFFNLMSYDEISRRTGCSTINARVMVNRARNTIMKKIKAKSK